MNTEPKVWAHITRQRISLTHPQPWQIDIRDIVLGLSRFPRYVGQSSVVETVAEHGVLTSALVKHLGGSPLERFAALNHDDAEAYLGDMINPIKSSGLVGEYGDLHSTWDRCIETAFEIPQHSLHLPIVQKADHDIYLFESAYLDRPTLERFPYPELEGTLSGLLDYRMRQSESRISNEFMKQFFMLLERAQNDTCLRAPK